MDSNEWRKLIRNTIAESKKSKDPLINKLAGVGFPKFKENISAEEFWGSVIDMFNVNGYVVNDLSCPESLEEVKHNRKLVRLLSNGG